MIYLELFLVFLKLGAFTFGGGAAMMPFLQDEVVDRGWLTMEQFIDFVAISESTPGPFAVNIATYVGVEKAGVLGSLCATLGLVLPSFVIILIIAKFYNKFKESNLVQGAMSGLKPASIGLIAAAVVSIGQAVLFPNGFGWDVFLSYNFITSVIIFVPMFILCIKKVHPVVVVLASGAMGVAFGFLEKVIIKT